MQITKNDDVFVQRLEEQKQLLQKCQKEQGIGSCMLCDKIIGCNLRKTYVNSVYESMSKGNTGGFEF